MNGGRRDLRSFEQVVGLRIAQRTEDDAPILNQATMLEFTNQMKNSSELQDAAIIPVESIAQRIFLIRGQKVMLDADLAKLYQVPTKRLNEAVKRNLSRFPQDFMFQLLEEEVDSLRSQFATSNTGRGGRRTSPYAFTEHGVVMISSVLSSDRAIQMNIAIVRAFVRLRELLVANKDLANRLEQIESRMDEHASVINILAEEINSIKAPPLESGKRPIGFQPE